MNKLMQQTIDDNKTAWSKKDMELAAVTDKLIKFGQSICTHTGPGGEDLMVEDGYDSHKTYYKCSNCGKETSL